MRKTIMVAVVSAVVGALVAVPVAVYASHSFTDVPDSNTFHEDIGWLASVGVTKGCNPPANTEFCPKDNVTREQMAAFLRRLAEGRVVDANTASAAKVATKALEADSLNGLSAGEIAPRASFNVTDDAPNGLDFTLPTNITAPAPGILLLSGGVDVVNTVNDHKYQCELELDNQHVDGSLRIMHLDGATGSSQEEDCATSSALVVDAGDYIVDLEVRFVDEASILSEASIWVLWVPLDAVGSIPTP